MKIARMLGLGRKQDEDCEAREAADAKAANARLLLHEVLLDEYQNLDQPGLFADREGRRYASTVKQYRSRFLSHSKAENVEAVAKYRFLLYRVLEARYADHRHAAYCVEDRSDRARRLFDKIKRRIGRMDDNAARHRASGGDGTGRSRPEKRQAGTEDYELESEAEAARHRLESRMDEELVQEFYRLMYAAHERAAEEALREPGTPRARGAGNGDGDGNGNGDGAGGEGSLREKAQTLRSALCLSGGGIRSATYNLGILQGLARRGLLDKFDYLSTVSGGGFIGGWLTAWAHRHSLKDVVDKLSKRPASPLTPDPAPVDHLRVYSNFLSPQPGLLSADTWTLLSCLGRNLLLNWFVFLPVIFALLLLPRVFVSLVHHSPEFGDGLSVALYVAVAGAVVGFSYTALSLPTVEGDSAPWTLWLKRRRWLKERKWVKNWYEKRGGQGRFLFFNLLPLVAAAAALALYCWAWMRSLDGTPTPRFFIGFAIVIIVVPLILSSVKVYANSPHYGRGEKLGKLAAAWVGVVIAQCAMGYLLWLATDALLVGLKWEDRTNGAQLYATFAPPVILVLMSLGAVLIAGFSSRVTNDADQEWWARAGAWVLIACVVWTAGHLLVLYGPVLFLWAGRAAAKIFSRRMELSQLTWGDALGALTVLGTLVSGAVTLFGGFSANTPANEKEARRAGLGSKLLNVLTGLLAPVFLAFILILIALATDWMLTWLARGPALWLAPFGPGEWASWANARAGLLGAASHAELLRETPLAYLFGLAALFLLASVVFGRLINTNAFSLHYMWRDRIIRAYLGASRASRRPNRFTGFDPADNIQMHQLRDAPGCAPPGAQEPGLNQRGKLFHVINVALNLTGGDKLAWQDRKAESMTISPLHAGSYWLGYRRTWKYGGDGARHGISLGTAVAISGAFVSPNMGYMMTSPVVRFLMTLFNVRFGWWLGNPGRAGDGTYLLERPLKWAEGKVLGDRPGFNLHSPRLSVLPIVEEAFGHTNDRSPYVYLSDGGHFENLGLYEMVLRRCRYIVVCDASTDADYSFESLAMSIRQIRVDLGVPIDLPDLSISGRSAHFRNKYCAVGHIRYSCVDKDPHGPDDNRYYDGVLVYLKPALIGGEPRDVTTYGLGSESFPQEVIVDQWFSEPQFESYRELASHTIQEICGGQDESRAVSLEEFRRKAEEHNQLDFRAYRDEIQYAAFEHLFKEEMGPLSPSAFKERARKYMEWLLK